MAGSRATEGNATPTACDDGVKRMDADTPHAPEGQGEGNAEGDADATDDETEGEAS